MSGLYAASASGGAEEFSQFRPPRRWRSNQSPTVSTSVDVAGGGGDASCLRSPAAALVRRRPRPQPNYFGGFFASAHWRRTASRRRAEVRTSRCFTCASVAADPSRPSSSSNFRRVGRQPEADKISQRVAAAMPDRGTPHCAPTSRARPTAPSPSPGAAGCALCARSSASSPSPCRRHHARRRPRCCYRAPCRRRHWQNGPRGGAARTLLSSRHETAISTRCGHRDRGGDWRCHGRRPT